MTEECYPIEDLEGVLAAVRRGDRPPHLERCPRCRALLDACTAFLDPPDLPEGSNLTQAAKHLSLPALAGFEDPRARTVLQERVSPARPRFRLTHPWLRPVWILGAAALAIVAVRGLRTGGEGVTPSGLMRGSESGAAVMLQTPEVGSIGEIRLRWEVVEGADAYELVLYRVDLTMLDRRRLPVNASLLLPPDEVASLARRGTRYWQIVAFGAGREIARSSPVAIDLGAERER